MNKKKLMIFALLLAILALTFTGCSMSSSSNGTVADTIKTKEVAANLQSAQPTPTDIDYSLERYNLIRRAYWVNGQREKAMNVLCEIDKPLGYVVLFAGNATVSSFVVDGKVSSLNSFLTPDSEYYELVSSNYHTNKWLADVDGTYGDNDCGIFFFTPDGRYIEWTGEYLYSDIPFTVNNPVVTYTMEDEAR